MTSYKWTIALDGNTPINKELVGGKAKSIADMKALGLPVPPAFVITTEACLAYLENGGLPDGLMSEVKAQLVLIEQQIGRQFGRGKKRLLLSVRSGAAISMPGMMDTVLNLGIDDEGEAALAAETGMSDFARNTHQRFIELYAAIVLNQPVELDIAADPGTWRAQFESYGTPLPTNVADQLQSAICAVFNSWNTRRAKKYRKHNGIADDLGTAVTVQAMVFGNLDDRSGTGVLFSRNPLTGEDLPYGEYLPRAQGEDVVSGKFTPLPLSTMQEREATAYGDLIKASDMLEKENKDVQDIEFTVQSGTLYLLQSRSAKRAPMAAIRFAVDMVDQGYIDIATALSRVSAEQVAAVLLPRLVDIGNAQLLARGVGACPGAASGILVADSDEAEKRAEQGDSVILVRKTTSPDDVHGMIAACGVITEQGGSTSHAAVVSRALGRPCIVGTGEGLVARAGEEVTIDGEQGLVYAGRLATKIPSETDDPRLSTIMAWIPPNVRNQVSALNADGSRDAFDLDAAMAHSEPEEVSQLLHGQRAVRGQSLSNPDMVRAAAGAGVESIFATPRLPAMLTLLEMERS